MMASECSRRLNQIGWIMINRRQALGLAAAVGFLPSRGLANVAPQRSEIRESLAKHYDEKTASARL